MTTSKCPRCGCPVREPYDGPEKDEDGHIRKHDAADDKCGHCGLEIAWIKAWVPVYKHEYARY